MNYKIIKDTIYPKNGLENRKRKTVRALLLNDNKIGLLHIKGDEPDFGIRNHLETPGGGIDDNESPIDALKREILEETGYTIKDIVYITTIAVEYNPLNRIDVSRVYACHIDENTNKTALLDYEKEIFNSFDFYDLETIEETFKTIHDEKVSKLIYQRELYAINKYKKMCKK